VSLAHKAACAARVGTRKRPLVHAPPTQPMPRQRPCKGERAAWVGEPTSYLARVVVHVLDEPPLLGVRAPTDRAHMPRPHPRRRWPCPTLAPRLPLVRVAQSCGSVRASHVCDRDRPTDTKTHMAPRRGGGGAGAPTAAVQAGARGRAHAAQAKAKAAPAEPPLPAALVRGPAARRR
jgi:hypothetical protein